MKVSDPAVFRTGIFEPECFQILVHLEHIMLLAGMGAYDVAPLDVILHALAQYPGLTPEDEPVFVEIVEMAVEPPPIRGDAEDSRTGDLAPIGPIARLKHLL